MNRITFITILFCFFFRKYSSSIRIFTEISFPHFSYHFFSTRLEFIRCVQFPSHYHKLYQFVIANGDIHVTIVRIFCKLEKRRKERKKKSANILFYFCPRPHSHFSFRLRILFSQSTLYVHKKKATHTL